MTGEEYLELIKKEPNVELVRPYYIDYDWHKKRWQDKSVTVLICQRKTRGITRLCLESLLQFYPDIPILVVDGNSEDDSSIYLKIKSTLYNNITIWTRIGRNSHGETMDEAIRNHIKTEYVLLMDSDVMVERGGFIEDMMEQLRTNPNMYATGTLMLVTRKGEACGIPADNSDILRYAHPSCSLYKVDRYKELKPFIDHGAPCVNNMIDAELNYYEIGYYPVDKYVSHLSGASWCVPKTIWDNSRNVFIRPFLSFILSNPIQVLWLKSQTDHDYDMHNFGEKVQENVIMHQDNISRNLSNNLYDIRFNINGEFICQLNSVVEKDFVFKAKEYVINNNNIDRFIIDGNEIVRRNIWQMEDALR